MAKRLDKFTKAFQNSRIPFLLTEVITDGQGNMVDLACRFANRPAADLLGLPVEDLQGRLSRHLTPRHLESLSPIQSVAFSGSSVSFSYDAVSGTRLTVTCYQVMYGVAACVLEPQAGSSRDPAAVLADHFPGAAAVLELSRHGLRCLSFHQRLCDLSGWSRKELLNNFSGDFFALVAKEDWSGLLQALLDAARENRPADNVLRLLRKDGTPIWVRLQAEVLAASGGVTTFCAVFLDMDQLRRTQEQLAQTHAQLTEVQGQLQALFSTLPGGNCLFRLPPDGAPQLLRLGRGLAELLDDSEAELSRQLSKDPLCRFPASERDALTAALLSARVNQTPLRHTCRIRARGGRTLWVCLEAMWQPQADGGALLYAALRNVTVERETEAELQFRSQLCDLLLSQSHMVSLDYDTAADSAHIAFFDESGHRATRTIGGYLDGIERMAAIHPEDRKRVAAALRRAAARPSTGTLEYRGNYGGQSWRWYRLSLASLFDSRGNVYRLLGTAEDISGRRASALRFRALSAKHKKQSRQALAAAELDLSADRILDARGADRHLARVLFGNSADACIRHMRDNIPDEAQRARFYEQCSPSALLEAFHSGTIRREMEHRFTVGGNRVVWARFLLELAENPDTRHVEAFFQAMDVDVQHRRSAVLDALAQRDYDAVLTVDASNGVCQLHGVRESLPPGTTYRTLTARYFRDQPPSRQRTALRRESRLETLLAHLEEQERYTLETVEDGHSRQLRCSWLDRERTTLLVTLRSL